MKSTLFCISVLVVMIFCMLPAYAEITPSLGERILIVDFQDGSGPTIIAAEGCTHTNYIFVSAYETIEKASHMTHVLVRVSTYHCTECDRIIQGKEYLRYEAHNMEATGNRHIGGDNKHEFYFACYCGETDRIIKLCYGPPCEVPISSLPVQLTSR